MIFLGQSCPLERGLGREEKSEVTMNQPLLQELPRSPQSTRQAMGQEQGNEAEGVGVTIGLSDS